MPRARPGLSGRPAILMLRRKLIIGLTVLAAAAFAGGAYAATQDSKTNARQAFLNDVAKRLHVTPAQLNSALTGAFQDQLNAAVKAGRLTQAQANAIQQRIKQRGGAPLLVPAFPGGRWRGLPFGSPPPAAGARAGGVFGAAEKYLGLTRRQVLTRLRSGQSLAQIAKAQGKTTAGLEQTITTALKARLDRAVASGLITSAREQQILSRLKNRLDAVVNRSFHIAHPGRLGPGTAPGPGWRGPGPGWGGPGSGPRGSGPGPGPGWGGPWPHPGSYAPPPPPGPGRIA